MNLRSLDDRWLPTAATAVQSWLRRWHARFVGLAGPGTTVGEGVRTQPALAGSVAVVTAAAIVLAIAGGPGGPGDSDQGGPAPVPTAVPAPVTTTVGPTPGTSVATYLINASFDLRHFGESSHGRAGYAVVDLRAYLRTRDVVTLFNGVDVVRAYVRAPAKGLPTQVHAIPLQHTFDAMAGGVQASARLAAATAHTFGELVAQIKPHTATDRLLRSRYALQKRASAFEAKQLGSPASCACVFSLVIHADDATMLRLAAISQIRAVDPVSADVSFNTLTVFPLEPEITGIVPRGGLFGG
jgi:hypothetical protein